MGIFKHTSVCLIEYDLFLACQKNNIHDHNEEIIVHAGRLQIGSLLTLLSIGQSKERLGVKKFIDIALALTNACYLLPLQSCSLIICNEIYKILGILNKILDILKKIQTYKCLGFCHFLF